MKSVTVPGILYALADPVRLAIVSALAEEDMGLSCVDMMNRTKTKLPKSTCSQHYQILREAGLITCERKGVELVSRLRRSELDKRFPGLLDSILKAHNPTKKRLTE
jgi:DNA-binding transcriptional ArsR family regulator